jgi:serine/threonine-protein kinase
MSLSAASEGERDRLIGAQVAGRYAITRVHSRGGMSVVYAALHEQQQREVAIKVLDPEIAAEPEAVERFLEEARTASSLSHGHVVGVTEFGRLPDGRPYLVMPMIAGTDMATLISEEGLLAPRRVATLLMGVASALDAMHEKGLVHRDIKSENLMHIRGEDGTETVLLLDFGISAARQSELGSAEEGGGGTPEFMAPEVLAGQPGDPRGDVYSLATVAFELMTGSLPFEGEDLSTLLHNKAAGKRRTLAQAAGTSFAPAVEAVLARGLAQDPAQRPRSAGELLRELHVATADAVEETTQVRPHKRRRHARSRTLHGTGLGARTGGAAGGTRRATHRSWNPKAAESSFPPPPGEASAEVTTEPATAPAATATAAASEPAIAPATTAAASSQDSPKPALLAPSTSPDSDAGAASTPATRAAATLREIDVRGLRPPPIAAPPPIGAPPPAALGTPPAAAGLAGLFDGIDVPTPRDEPVVLESDARAAARAILEDSLRPPQVDLDDEDALRSRGQAGRWLAYSALAAIAVAVLALWGPAPSDPPSEPAAEPTAPAAAAAPRPEPAAAEPAPAPSLQAPPPAPVPTSPAAPPSEPGAALPAALPAAPATSELAAPAPAADAPSPAARARKPAAVRPRKAREPKEAATAAASSVEREEPPASKPEREPPSEAKSARASAPELTQEGTEAMLRGDFAAASAAFQRAIKADPRHAPAYRGKGLVLERMNRSKEAARAFKQFLKLTPDAPGADKIRGRLEALESAQ